MRHKEVSAIGTGCGSESPSQIGASSALETDLSRANDPRQGARLVRAFLRITDPRVRLAIVHMVEKMEFAAADC